MTIAQNPAEPGPPAHLSERSAALWRAVVPGSRSAGRLELLTVALEARDRADSARREIEAAGLTFENKVTGACHAHPAVKIEKDALTLFVRCWDLLALRFSMGVDGR